MDEHERNIAAWEAALAKHEERVAHREAAVAVREEKAGHQQAGAHAMLVAGASSARSRNHLCQVVNGI